MDLGYLGVPHAKGDRRIQKGGGFAVEAYPGEYLAIGRASEGRKAVKEIMGWFIIER